ncbi:beta-phosphoglucomutase [Mycoplasmopsis felis]|uniref:beta-phosphoglucomutase n=1 Tax=Mycoplasmopsis felis TaxID=33923 RepID=UPI002AFFEF77|nr:beta-phosphoglucomutase [Mycoplasmopsis felis]WQQ09082.1 beta-phosphoglucomutase [Mycoplasmopsis felis]
MIKGFVFDLDGVITDTAVLHYKSWKEVAKKLGIDYTEADNEKLRGIPRLETLKEIIKLKKPELKLSTEELLNICEIKNNLYKELLNTEINKDSVLPNIKNFLLNAKSYNIKLSIASSSFNAPNILKKLELFELFDYIVYPGDIKNGKPAPDIFIAGANGIGLKTSECIGFEDAIAGIQGIKDAQMLAIAITNGSNEDFSKADLILNSTSDLDFDFIINKFNKA